jgi:hypothetical protein
MKIIEPGHIYELNWLDCKPQSPDWQYIRDNKLVFVNREATPHPGTQTQEVLRALIDRTRHCDNCLRWPGNDLIIQHLQLALVLHEARALERKTIKGIIKPERIATSVDGHFRLVDE